MAAVIRVEVRPAMLSWARERSGLDANALAQRFPKLADWERGERLPTLKQLEDFAHATHAPMGFFFLPEPPAETIPIPDFRTVGSKGVLRPSPDLLDTVYICQQRQEWYREFARSTRSDPLSFVGSVSTKASVEDTAGIIREALGFDIDERKRCPTWTDALRRFIEQIDALGVLVMVTGVVGNNNYRNLNPDEFRGFAISDAIAPLIFVNGADTKAAQMFTLAHELAHIWLGQSALSDAEAAAPPQHGVENWCNRVAAEILVPLAAIKREYSKDEDLDQALKRLAKVFKVSTLVILRCIHDIGGFTTNQFWVAYRAEVARLMALPGGTGGNFYLTQAARVGKRFARALVVSTLEGQTLHRDAFRLLGFSKLSTFRELAMSLGVV
jgi:Zn-dependent peptidase ImmA (M78 family)